MANNLLAVHQIIMLSPGPVAILKEDKVKRMDGKLSQSLSSSLFP